MLSPLFVGGFLSSCGSFIEYKRSGRSYFAFQIKTASDNHRLLDQIATFFGINNRVYNFTSQKQSYALLIIRNRHVVEKNLLPFFDEYLEGFKKLQYLDWKSRFIKNSSTWNFRKIQGKENPDIYTVVDNDQNKRLLQGG